MYISFEDEKKRQNFTANAALSLFDKRHTFLRTSPRAHHERTVCCDRDSNTQPSAHKSINALTNRATSVATK